MLPPHSDPVVVQLVAQLQQQLDAQTKQLHTTSNALQYAQLKIQVLEERLRLARIAKYGNGSETLSDLQLELLELEPGVSSEEVQAESGRGPLASSGKVEVESAARKQKHPGRQTLPAHLERVETILACTPEQCLCAGCGKETTVIGYEASEVLDVSMTSTSCVSTGARSAPAGGEKNSASRLRPRRSASSRSHWSPIKW